MAESPRRGRGEGSNDKLLQEVLRLVQASKNGQLSERANAAAFAGDDAKLLSGLNEMLDAILLPIGEGNRILDQIANGKVDELIAETYQGDHEKMKQNVNAIALVLQKFQAEFVKLTEYSRKGKLERRGDASGVRRRVWRDHQRRQRNARRHPVADRRGQSHSRPDRQGQDRRVDRPNLPGRSREDEAERQRHRASPAEIPGRIRQADRVLAPGQARKARRRCRIRRRLWRDHQGRQRNARRHPAADRRGQSHSRPDRQGQDRRVDRPNLPGRSREDEAERQRHRASPAEIPGRIRAS